VPLKRPWCYSVDELFANCAALHTANAGQYAISHWEKRYCSGFRGSGGIINVQPLTFTATYFRLHGTTFQRAFRISAPKICNSYLLSPHILQSQTLSSFRHHLQTHYTFSQPPAPSLAPVPNAPRFSPKILALYINHLLTYLLTNML